MRFKIGIISLIFMFCLSFLSSPALASNEPWRTPPIPDGWSHVEGAWNNGYVIKDSHGNEFVWVPVGAVNKNAAGKAELKAYDWGKLGYGSIKAPDEVTYVNDSNVTKVNNAIATTGGFYVARYQASNNGGKAQSKKNVPPWNSIDWHSSKSKSESMATDYGWTGLYSHLLYDKEWDVIVKWLENSGVNVTDSSAYGNYSGSLKNTGSSESYKKNNIYDLAGNLWEWTMDAPSSSSGSRLLRGGYWYYDGGYNPVSYRIDYSSAYDSNSYGFRSAFVVLNSAPSVALKNPAQGAEYSEVEGHNQVVVSGIVTDADNDDVTVYIQVKKGGTIVGSENKVLQQCQSGKEFSFELNIDNQIDEGKYTIEIWADDGK